MYPQAPDAKENAIANDDDGNSVGAGIARQGKLSYMQIPALDVEASAQFYANVFGWTLTGDSSHRSFADTSGELIGAFVPDRAISSQPGILPYVDVDKIDSTAAQIEAQGGEIVRAPYPEGGLWVATFRDPAGNVLGVWTSGGRD